MKPFYIYLDELADRGIMKDDAAVARHLGISRASVSEWRKGKTAPSPEHARVIAGLLGRNPGEVMAEAIAYRAKDTETIKAWERIAKLCAAACYVGLGVTAAYLAMTADASIVTSDHWRAAPLLALSVISDPSRFVLC